MELPVAASPSHQRRSKVEPEPEIHMTASIPSREPGALVTLLRDGQLVVLPVSVGAIDRSTGPSERSLEPREFSRGNPVLDPGLSAEAKTELGTARKPVDFSDLSACATGH